MSATARASAQAATQIASTRRQRRRYGRTSAPSGNSGSVCGTSASEVSRGITTVGPVESDEAIDHATDLEMASLHARNDTSGAKRFGTFDEYACGPSERFGRSGDDLA